MNRYMIIASLVAACVVMSVRAALITPEHHQNMQKLCGSLPDLSILGQFKDETKAKLSPLMQKVCDVYKRLYIKKKDVAVQTRSLLGGLGDLMGSNSKLSTLLKAADALNKAKGVFDEVKKVAPTVHEKFQDSIKDIHDTFQDLIDSIANEYMDKTTPTPSN